MSIAIFLVEFEDEITNMFPYINSMLVLALGVPSFFCASVYLSDKKYSTGLKIGVYGGIVLLLFFIFLYLPDSKQTLNTSIPYIRYGIYNAIAHLLVAFIPFISKRQVNGFWNYNKGLFIRLILSLIYSFCLYVDWHLPFLRWKSSLEWILKESVISKCSFSLLDFLILGFLL